jgi:hypothetical protein
LPFVAASYVLTGRFNPEHEFEKYPTAGPSAEDFTPPPMLQAAASPEDREQIVGSPVEWKEYKSELEAIVQGNKAELDQHDLSHFLKQLDRTATASIDSDGSVWMEVVEDGEALKVGVSANNALARGSNRNLSYKFLLARTAGVLKSPKHSRETMLEFRQDWDSLQRASSEIGLDAAANPAAPKNPTEVQAVNGSKD